MRPIRLSRRARPTRGREPGEIDQLAAKACRTWPCAGRPDEPLPLELLSLWIRHHREPLAERDVGGAPRDPLGERKPGRLLRTAVRVVRARRPASAQWTDQPIRFARSHAIVIAAVAFSGVRIVAAAVRAVGGRRAREPGSPLLPGTVGELPRRAPGRRDVIEAPAKLLMVGTSLGTTPEKDRVIEGAAVVRLGTRRSLPTEKHRPSIGALVPVVVATAVAGLVGCFTAAASRREAVVVPFARARRWGSPVRQRASRVEAGARAVTPPTTVGPARGVGAAHRRVPQAMRSGAPEGANEHQRRERLPHRTVAP